MGKCRTLANLAFCLALVLLLASTFGVTPLTPCAVAEGSDPGQHDEDSCAADTATAAEPLKTGEEINVFEFLILVLL